MRGLGAVLTRSAETRPELRALPPDGAIISNNPHDLTMMALGHHKKVLPVPSEHDALALPAFWRGHNYVCGTVGLLPVTAWRGQQQLTPQPGVLRQPDINQTPMAFWAGVTSSLSLYGNSICRIVATDRLGYPTALLPIHPTLAAVRLVGDPQTPIIAGWFLGGAFVDRSQVWHVKSFIARPGYPLGMGILDAAPDGVALARAVSDYAASYFDGGGVPPGVLKIHRPEVTQDQADEAKRLWRQKFAGKSEPAVLNELTDFTPVAFNPVDSQMVEARQLSLNDVALLWGLPASKLGSQIGSGTYRNAEMEEVQARNDGVSPWTRLLEQAISLDLLPRGQTAEWRMDAYLRTDTEGRFKAYQTALGGPGPESAWMLKNEVRALEHLDPLEHALADDAALGAGGRPLPAVTSGEGGPAEANPTPASALNGNGSIPALNGNGGGRHG